MPRLSKIGAAALAAFGWTSGSAGVTASYLVVAGGGGAGSNATSGAGAGGLLTGSVSLSGSSSYTITVGAGGSAGTFLNNDSTSGSSSSIGSLVTTVGGGRGPDGGQGAGSAGVSGGSGSGAGGSGSTALSGGAGTAGQGNAGGSNAGVANNVPGGGGGAGAVGANGSGTQAGAGGIGVSSSINGTATYYAGGGGGGVYTGVYSNLAGAGGLGGGGAGGTGNGSTSTNGTAGTANTGGGGGGAGYPGVGGAGGSGVVIISYPAPQIFWGGFVTTSGGNIIHTFTTSGSLTPVTTTVSANYLVVAGGGGGTFAFGGAGAGGMQTGTTTLTLANSYTVTVGAGGAVSNQGSNSQFGSLTASIGGGYGPSGNGGSGAGSFNGNAAGTGTAGQGNSGGVGITDGATYNSGGGGGGAGASGSGGNSSGGGAGGVGLTSSISGTSTYYAGGGGGGGDARVNTGGSNSGGAGGGGNGGRSSSSWNGTSGTPNTGGGGGSGGYTGSGYGSGAQGGSGVVIISYAGQQLFGGGVVTFVNGNTIHTFNTSGTLTPISQLSADYLIVGGGGGGSFSTVTGGGAGAGGVLSGSGVAIDTNSTYLVTVGAGGAKASNNAFGENGTAGSVSSFFNITTLAPTYPTLGASGTSGNGYAGGATGGNTAGGGGGASAVGGAGNGTNGGAGGAGITSSISGTSTQYAGGGSGGSDTGTATAAVYNGGVGASNAANGVDAPANYGGGGGGGRSGYFSGSYYAASNGGSGVVIIRYAGSTQLMAGGTVTITGGYVIHTFTSSGYLAPLKYVGNSLRFRLSNSAYLSRTQSASITNAYKWTWSAWVKRGSFGTNHNLFGGGSGSSGEGIQFTNGDSIEVYSYNGSTYDWRTVTNAVYRDPAAWYHLTLAVDGTQATASNRTKLYVNGVQITSFSTETYPSQNTQYSVNLANAAMTLGRYGAASASYYDGYMTEINFIDGQALTPNAFGSFNSYGVWQPITYGGSYGTNGFYLPFTASQSYSASFNGSSQYLTATSSTAFNFGSGDFTVEGWFYAISKPVAHQAIIQKGSATVNNAYDWRLYWGDVSTNQIWFDCAAFSFSGYAATNNLTLNAWNHIAVVRSGSSAYMFVNGQPAYGATTASGSITNTYSDVVLGAANLGGAGQTYFNGYMSNVRIVKGTAVYTSAFTPSTTPLTAITNTQLLTLQNATIVDNSTNALSIANTGSVVTAGVYPFAYLVNTVKDQGPAGNNWTANNIGQISGSTLDTMTDVPTLTSSTAANTCTLNPITAYSASIGTITNGNLSWSQTGTAAYGKVVGTMGMSGSGKFYWETTFVSANLSEVGILLASDQAIYYPGYSPNGYVYYFDGRKGNNNNYVSYGASYTAGDVIGVAYDCSTGTLTFYKNGTSQGTAYTGLSGTFLPAFGNDSSNPANITNLTVNFGQQPFVYTPPTGYVALNTYNL